MILLAAMPLMLRLRQGELAGPAVIPGRTAARCALWLGSAARASAQLSGKR